MKIDKKLIKELTDYLNEFNLTELEYGDNDTKIKVSKSNPVSSHVILEDKNLTSASIKNQTSSEKKNNFSNNWYSIPLSRTWC